MLKSFERLRDWHVALIIVIVGVAVFALGLNSPFQGDDLTQIVNNQPVHSISSIRQFFDGGTFFNGSGNQLTGINYRPLMTTVFSLIYTIFGSRPLYFHLFQLFLRIGSAFVLYLFFKYSFKRGLSLILAFIFLIHPINSQVVFSIPAMQDALFFFFGILALYLLIRFVSLSSLSLVAACLFLSLLAKESGALFIVVALLFLLGWDRRRLVPFMGIMTLPVIAWLLLRIHAVGLHTVANAAPIDSLSLGGRVLTIPSIVLFYITKLLIPWKLASAYYWVFPHFSWQHTMLPLFVDIIFIGFFVYLGILVHTQAKKAQYYTYLFFAAWACLGLAIVLQFYPLDMTVSENWFYFSMAGLLGMIGIALSTIKTPLRLNYNFLALISIVILLALAGRTFARGYDWSHPSILAAHDLTASKEDYTALDYLATVAGEKGQYGQAVDYAKRSISIHPYITNYSDLGVAYANQGKFAEAMDAYNTGLHYGEWDQLYENIARLTLLYGEPATDRNMLVQALDRFPRDSVIWLQLALLNEKSGNNAEAKTAIANAAAYGQVPQFIYENIMQDHPFTVIVSGKHVVNFQ